MNKTISAMAAALLIGGGVYYYLAQNSETVPEAAERPEEGAPLVAVTLPDTLTPAAERGKMAFDAVCAACHGVNAAGKMGFGPPLIHKVYEPSHHGDMAFQMAVGNGVRAHHWPFGDMPAQEGLTRADVGDIVAYVREVQRTNGIN